VKQNTKRKLSPDNVVRIGSPASATFFVSLLRRVVNRSSANTEIMLWHIQHNTVRAGALILA